MKEKCKNQPRGNRTIWRILAIGIILAMVSGIIVTLVSYNEFMDLYEKICNNYPVSSQTMENFKNDAILTSFKRGIWVAFLPLLITFGVVGVEIISKKEDNLS